MDLISYYEQLLNSFVSSIEVVSTPGMCVELGISPKQFKSLCYLKSIITEERMRYK